MAFSLDTELLKNADRGDMPLSALQIIFYEVIYDKEKECELCSGNDKKA